jgi:hypothetical protein
VGFLEMVDVDNKMSNILATKGRVMTWTGGERCTRGDDRRGNKERGEFRAVIEEEGRGEGGELRPVIGGEERKEVDSER